MVDAMDRGSLYDHDIPSLSASLEAFDPERSMHNSAYSVRSNLQSSSRWSAQDHDDPSEPESEGPWAPPAWQRSNNHWYRKSLLSESPLRASPAKSSTYYDRSERDITPSRIPLPDSPLKQTPRTSPEPVSEQERRYFAPENIASRMQSPAAEAPTGAGAQEDAEEVVELSHNEERPDHLDGFVRLAIRGETLFRTAPVEGFVTSVSDGLHLFTRSRLSVLCTIGAVFFAYLLTIPWNETLIPDVANIANMAKRFEPLLYASEGVVPRIRELADASIAVQDLGESVRATNMSASTAIIEQLDDLADSLYHLSESMRTFFTHVDSDMDSILLTMDWAKRELATIQGPRAGMVDTVIGNFHSALSKVGVLERDGEVTAVGRVVNDVIGLTKQQRAKATLQRTFDGLLAEMEENVAEEMARSNTLEHLFETVDQQFHNLHRSVAREEDSLTTEKDEFLASMWRQTTGNKLKIKKYEKNLKLLKSVRASTLTNKSEMKSHIQVIKSVKEQLDKARKNLISPLIRRAQSNSFGIEQQLTDLSGTYNTLKSIREKQRHRVLQTLLAPETRKRISVTAEPEHEDEVEE